MPENSNLSATNSHTTESDNLLKIQSWIKSSRIGYLIIFIAGALLALAYSPVDLYFISVLSPALLFYSFLFATPRRAAWLGWWFGMGFFGVGVSCRRKFYCAV